MERQKYLKNLYRKMEQNQENFSIVELWGKNFKGRTLKNSELSKSMNQLRDYNIQLTKNYDVSKAG